MATRHFLAWQHLYGARHEQETILEETRVWIGGRTLRNSETLIPEVKKWVQYEDIHYVIQFVLNETTAVLFCCFFFFLT